MFIKLAFHLYGIAGRGRRIAPPWPSTGARLSSLSNATLAESPIEILLWEIPLNSHLRMLLKLTRSAISFSRTEVSRTARHAAIDHELCLGHGRARSAISQ